MLAENLPRLETKEKQHSSEMDVEELSGCLCSRRLLSKRLGCRANERLQSFKGAQLGYREFVVVDVIVRYGTASEVCLVEYTSLFGLCKV